MFRIIRIDRLARYIALCTITLSVLTFWILRCLYPDTSLFKIVTFSSIFSLVIISILVIPKSARGIWKLFRRFDKSLYPDLNGSWEGEVDTGNEKFPVKCVIRQGLLRTEIDMHGPTMKSITIETTPATESGQHKLYYTYRTTPKNPSFSDYFGSTLFDIRKVDLGEKFCLELTGKYFTDRKTVGRISLRHIGGDLNEDVSFY